MPNILGSFWLKSHHSEMVEIGKPVFVEWIERFYRTIVMCQWPLLVHCTASKDRTGVSVVLLLKNLEISDSAIVSEYEKTEGKCYPERIRWVIGGVHRLSYLMFRSEERATLKYILLA